ncbi:hypothetical protein BDB00DRAFT_924338 [Zychaea mexicana]|uniref:uncharacterized protein n=1 Tax=Zychaea mexicana TaxID=64656 RepID=UPI0022FE1C8F|nr:uncharacterized protein BDB00DRAFT_924338 [Zychaea mexicana]KAI9499679.1 hypothetical protein BDB00DRAFT_924338 [Zychaea mexicana]
MIRVILSVLGISQLWAVSKDSWCQWRKLRQMKKSYQAIMCGKGASSTVINSDGSDITATQSASDKHYINDTADITPTTGSTANDTTRTIPLFLSYYAKLVLELKEQEKTLLDAGEARMLNMASTAMVLCAVGFIPSCIASLGVLYDDDTIGAEYEHDQATVGLLLVLLGVWCSFSILQTIFWYRMIPSYVSRRVLGKLVRSRRRTSTEIYHVRILNQLRQEWKPSRRSSGAHKTMVNPQLIDKCLLDIHTNGLDEIVIDSTDRIIVLQFLFPFHDIINWLMYPVMLLLQVIILYFLWRLPKNEDYDTSMKGQNIFSIWIFVLNALLILATPSHRCPACQDDDDDVDSDDNGYNHHALHRQDL